VLENLSSLATLTLNVRERDKYAPPPPIVADFPTQIARTWESSLLALVNVGKALVPWAVAWALWVPFLLVAALLAWVLVRWLIRVFIRNRARIVELARTPITPPRAPTAGA
jgi:Flp pilus assembly protein TadB